MALLTDEQLVHNLHDALKEMNSNIFLLLIDETQKDGRQVNLTESSSLETPTLLQHACELEAQWAVESLLNKVNVDPNKTSKKNAYSPLILAIEKGSNVKIVELLLKHQGISPYVSIKHDSESNAATLVLHRVVSILGNSVPVERIDYYKQCLDLLLKAPLIDVNARDKNGRTALHMATLFGDEESIVKLLEKGADPHLKDNLGHTVLHQVGRGYHDSVDHLVKCLQIFLNYGSPAVGKGKANKEMMALATVPIDVNAKDFANSTALHWIAVKMAKTDTPETEGAVFQCLDLLLTSPSINMDAQDKYGRSALHITSLFGSVKAVEKLLEKGADPHLKDKEGRTLLHQVVRGIQLKIDTEEQLADLVKCFRILTVYGHYHSVEKKPTGPIDINAVDSTNSTVLHLIVVIMGKVGISSEKMNHLCQCLDLLLNSPSINIHAQDKYGHTALHLATRFGTVEAVLKLVEKDIDPHLKNKWGQTALHQIALGYHPKSDPAEKAVRLVKCLEILLLKRGVNHEKRTAKTSSTFSIVDINAPDDTNSTILHYVVKEMKNAVTSEEIEHYVRLLNLILNCPDIQIDAQDKEGKTALHVAAKYSVVEAISVLLGKGANHGLIDYEGLAVLHYTIREYHPKISTSEKCASLLKSLDVMLKWGHQTKNVLLPVCEPVNVNQIDLSTSLSPLQYLILKMGDAKTLEEKSHYLKCCNLLIESPFINVNSQDDDGNSALHISAEHGLVEVVEKLLNKKADLHLRNNDGQTILHKVSSSGHISEFERKANYADKGDRLLKCLEILLCRLQEVRKANGPSMIPIDINSQDLNGQTALHYAIHCGFEEMVKLLLCNGAMLDKDACRMVLPSTLQSFFDSCIRIPSWENIRTMRFSTTFDFSPLLTQQSRSIMSTDESVYLHISPEEEYEMDQHGKKNRDDCIYLESEILWYISRSLKHQHLLKHPLVKSFLMLKWHSIKNIYWTNTISYALFLLLCSTYILLLYSDWNEPIVVKALDVLWYLLLISDSLYLFWEFLQFCTIPFLYWRSFENWIDMAMLSTTLTILYYSGHGASSSVRHLSAVAILLAWTEGLIIFSRHPQLSIYVTMFRKVSITFLWLFLWFSVLLIGFAFSFFLVFGSSQNQVDMAIIKAGQMDEESNGFNGFGSNIANIASYFMNSSSTYDLISDENDNQQEVKTSNSVSKEGFANIYDSFLKFMVMMKDEFEFDDLPFETNPVTSRLLFVTFIFLVTIVLINLLNGLAITDIQAIQREAETLTSISQVQSFAIPEFILLGDPSNRLRGWVPIKRILKRYTPINASKLRNSNRIIQFIYKRTFFFYKCSPKKKLTFDFRGHIKPYSLLQKREMMRSITSSAHSSDHCDCHRTFQLGEDLLSRSQQKALENQENNVRQTENTNISFDNPAAMDVEKFKIEVRQMLLDLQNEQNSRLDLINLVLDKIGSEIGDLKQNDTTSKDTVIAEQLRNDLLVTKLSYDGNESIQSQSDHQE